MATKAVRKIHKMTKKKQQINLVFIFFILLPDVIAFLVYNVISGQRTMCLDQISTNDLMHLNDLQMS